MEWIIVKGPPKDLILNNNHTPDCLIIMIVSLGYMVTTSNAIIWTFQTMIVIIDNIFNFFISL